MAGYYRAGHDLCGLSESAAVARQLWRTSGLGPKDVDTAVLYDHFTPFIPMRLEKCGFRGRGEAAAFAADGGLEPGGRLPVNAHGGQLGEAYPHGMHGIAEAVRQLRGTGVNQGPGAAHVPVTAATGVPTSGLLLGAAD